MRLLALGDLTDRERGEFFETIRAARGLPVAFGDVAEMEHWMLGPAFEKGRTYLTLWDDDGLVGAVGVVVREIVVKNEVFLTLLYVLGDDADGILMRLLREAYGVIERFGGADAQTVVKIGVGAKESYLHGALARAGWCRLYGVLNMVRPLEGVLPADGALRFEPLTAENQADFIAVHNAAFRGSPNVSGACSG